VSYGVLAMLFLTIAVLVALTAAVTVGLSRRWWLTTGTVAAVLIVLTAVFDSVMIAANLFRYDTSELVGFRVLLVPIEDFTWPVAAAVALPALWELLALLSTRSEASTTAPTEVSTSDR
jgi:lycopene cyclase domain-containing protein